mmetsp:Transcript_30894/g.54504  ORF Transcript_30894/g.54504 Transcript_30894/m.54504 type:complete len:208 (-) Transcript_30894:879-1502(-)
MESLAGHHCCCCHFHCRKDWKGPDALGLRVLLRLDSRSMSLLWLLVASLSHAGSFEANPYPCPAATAVLHGAPADASLPEPAGGHGGDDASAPLLDGQRSTQLPVERPWPSPLHVPPGIPGAGLAVWRPHHADPASPPQPLQTSRAAPQASLVASTPPPGEHAALRPPLLELMSVSAPPAAWTPFRGASAAPPRPPRTQAAAPRELT